MKPWTPPADHPPSCQVCDGTGWQPGQPVVETVNGKPHEYPTLEPCQHRWSNDEHGYRHVQALAAGTPRALAAFARGHTDGQHDLWELSHGQLGAERRDTEVA